MAGNVWEWCADGWDEYTAEPVSNPQGSEQATARVVRGGGWDDSVYVICGPAFRDRSVPEDRRGNLGFRVA